MGILLWVAIAAFVFLKLAGVIAVSWWWLAIAAVPFAISLLIVLLFGLLALMGFAVSMKLSK